MLFDVVYFALLVSIHAFSPPTLESDKETQHDPTIGDFVEVDPGEEVRLTCSDIMNEAVEFLLPNLTDNQGHSEVDFNSRYRIEDVSYGHILHIKDLQESDTGTYTCHSKDDPTLSSQIHLFVKGSKVFVPTIYSGLVIKTPEFVVPCKTSRHVSKDEVEIGFKINSKNAEDKISDQLSFECTYKGYPPDTATFFIVIHEAQKNDLELLFEEHSDVVHTKSARNDMISHTITVETLTPEDSGQYVCGWYFDQQLNQTIQKTVVISPKKGQIKKYVKPPKTLNETENLVNDNDHQIASERLNDGQVTEKIAIKNAATDMSGIYVLTIELLDTVKTIEWKV
ncbi:unnamed protein product [Strongylus vulgaris]|uniref:Immunoglobulin domain-containing protein n=1 Tax=Strongylus vulgaris TaxID=40348 RepID=A0A3P7IXT7_STRVU|nr:unnamed protein product [Strongylus vulgaris]